MIEQPCKKQVLFICAHNSARSHDLPPINVPPVKLNLQPLRPTQKLVQLKI